MAPLKNFRIGGCGILAAFLSYAQAKETINLGACFGYFNQMGAFIIMAKVALDEGYFDDILPVGGKSADFTVKVKVVDDTCSGSISSLVGLPLLLGQGAQDGRIYSSTTLEPVVAIAGCSCSGATIPISSMATNYKVPMVSGSATNPTLSNKGLHPYFSRVVPPDSMQGVGFAALVKYFHWTRLLMVYPAEDYATGVATAAKVRLAVLGGVTVIEYQLQFQELSTPDKAATFKYQDWITVANQVANESPQPRVFLTAGIQTDHVVRIFYDLGLVGPSTLWMTAEGTCGVDLLRTIGPQQAAYVTASKNDPWFKDFDWMKIPALLKGFLCLTPKSFGPKYTSTRFQNFFANVNKAKLDANGWYSGDKSDYWDDKWMTKAWFMSNVYNPLAFDSLATIIYAIGTMLSLGNTSAQIKGQTLLKTIRGLVYESITGVIAFDNNGDRLAPYEVMNMRVDGSGSPTLKLIGLYDGVTDTVQLSEAPVFADGTGKVPSDRPAACQVGYEFGGIQAGCIKCQLGTVSVAVDSRCSPCQPGYYQDREGGAACIPTPAGGFVNTTGAVIFGKCPSGQYTSEKGLTVCSDCLSGFSQALAGKTACDRCPRAEYSGNRATVCAKCAAGMTTESTASGSINDCQCPEGEYCEGSYPQCTCKSCPEGMTCPFGAKSQNLVGPAYSGERPQVKPGYYTTKDQPMSVYLCHPSRGNGVCPGGDPQSCKNNLAGLTCSACEPGWSIKGDKCVACSGGNAAVLVIAPLIGIIICAIVYYTGNRQVETNSTVMLGCSCIFGLIVTVMQIFATFDQLTLPWPSGIKGFFSGSKFFVVNPGALAVECMAKGESPVNQYLVRFFLPLAVLMAMLVCYAIAKVLGCAGVLPQPRRWELPKVTMCLRGAYMSHRGRLGWSGPSGLRQNWGTSTH